MLTPNTSTATYISVAMVTSSPSSSAVVSPPVSPQKPKHSDISSVCSDTTSSCDDDDILSTDIPFCDMDSILNILWIEI